MKNLKLEFLAYIVLPGILLSGCAGLEKMKKESNHIDYKVTPEVLETHSGMVDMEITVVIPPKYFNKKAILIATPVLKFENGERAFPSQTLQGEKVLSNNMVVPYEAGKTITYRGEIPYQEAMRISELEVRITASKADKSIDFDSYKIADGVVATATLVENSPLNINAKDNFQRITTETKEANLHYLINSSVVRKSELNNKDIHGLKSYLGQAKEDANRNIKEIEIKSYSSPEGEPNWNEKLANERKNKSDEYVSRELKKINFKKATLDKCIDSKVTAEDWLGFKKAMEESNIKDKELILRVLSMYSDPEVREKEIRNISAVFTEVKEKILPQLRRSTFNVKVDVVGKSDEELESLLFSNPSVLSADEILFAANLIDSSKKNIAYGIIEKQFPNEWRAYNDHGIALIKEGKLIDAKVKLEKADQLSDHSPVVKNNLGGLEMAQGNIIEAEKYFAMATGAGEEVNHNLGIIAINKSKYDQAIEQYNESTEINAALANILGGKYQSALKKLNSNKSELAMIDYLKAVVGARTNNDELIFSNLKKAVNKDNSIKSIAKSDIEFSKIFEDEKFKAIVE